MPVTVASVKLATTVLAGWMSASAPLPLPAADLALVIDGHLASPVEVHLLDGNRQTTATVTIARDGWTDPATTQQLAHVFRCRTGHEHVIAPRTLAMLADLGERYAPHAIEFISGYRVRKGESMTSPHRAARAIDFRIRGVALREVRDYLWRTYRDVGIGWYPEKQFLHMDSRPSDMSWTFLGGTNHYHPTWSKLARRLVPPAHHRPGV